MDSTPADSRTLAQLVGENVRLIREREGLTLDAVVRSARQVGLKWSTARVVELQNGKLAVSAGLLLALPHVLGSAAGRRLTVGDLLAGDGLVQLTPDLTVTVAAARSVIAGRDAPFRIAEVAGGHERLASGALKAVTASGRVQRSAKGDWDATLAAAGLADERASSRLGMPLIEFLSHAHELWGRSLTAERDARAVGATSQERGQITRQLEREIRAAISEEGE